MSACMDIWMYVWYGLYVCMYVCMYTCVLPVLLQAQKRMLSLNKAASWTFRRPASRRNTWLPCGTRLEIQGARIRLRVQRGVLKISSYERAWIFEPPLESHNCLGVPPSWSHQQCVRVPQA